MYSVLIVSVVITFVGLAHADRNIIPSPAVCATFPNEEFAVDLRRCQNTCEFYGRNFDCPKSYYKPSGDCYCKNGFARLADDGKCVSVTKNAVCVGRLPVAKAACNKPNEKFSTSVQLGTCDISCLTYGCWYENDLPTNMYKWAPNCDCVDNYRRDRNGNCIHISDPQCVAEYQPSTARCNALGQIYTVNAPCQPSCHGETFCPPAGPACICPPDKVMYQYNETYYTIESVWSEEYEYSYDNYISHPTEMMACLYEEECPSTTVAAG